MLSEQKVGLQNGFLRWRCEMYLLFRIQQMAMSAIATLCGPHKLQQVAAECLYKPMPMKTFTFLGY